MKKLMLMLIACAFVLGSVACGGKQSSTTDESGKTVAAPGTQAERHGE